MQKLQKFPEIPTEYAEHVAKMDEAQANRIAELQQELDRCRVTCVCSWLDVWSGVV